MKKCKGVLAYFFAAMVVTIIWREFASPFGKYAGFIAAIIAIGPVWYICHYKGFIPQSEDEIAIDMGGAIGTAAFVSSAISNEWYETIRALPTLVCLLIGAGLAGLVYEKMERGKRH